MSDPVLYAASGAPRRRTSPLAAALCGLGALLLPLCGAGSSAWASDPHAHHAHGGDHDPHAHHGHHGHHGHDGHHEPDGSATAVELLDLPVVDHEGVTRLFRSEVIGDRVVALNVMFTNCTTVCPVVSAIFQQVQARLGDELGARLGDDLLLLSVSVDPARDTPQRLAEYRQRYDAQDGWVWLTGARPDVSSILTGLGAYTPEPESHPVMVLVGDGRSNEWRRHFGFTRPEDIVTWLEEALARREATP